MAVTLWVDADACPRALRDLLARAAERRRVLAHFVANSSVSLPDSPYLRASQVGRGADAADDLIASRAQLNDVVVTQDIPLAARLVPLGAHVITPHGRELNADNIAERLSVRDFLTEARDMGVVTGGPPPFGEKQRQAFAQSLDRVLTRALKAAERAARG